MIPRTHVNRLLSVILGWIAEGGSQSAGIELADFRTVKSAATDLRIRRLTNGGGSIAFFWLAGWRNI
jgi:hypothetical protein